MSKEDMSGLDETFNTVEAVGEVIPPKNKLHLKKPVEGDDVIKDYEYARGNLYSLIDKGQEAVNGALDLAMSSDHPRAYEVAGQLIKVVGDTTQELLKLQKNLKELKKVDDKAPRNVTNALFVGSTSELQKLINGKKEGKDE